MLSIIVSFFFICLLDLVWLGLTWLKTGMNAKKQSYVGGSLYIEYSLELTDEDGDESSLGGSTVVSNIMELEVPPQVIAEEAGPYVVTI